MTIGNDHRINLMINVESDPGSYEYDVERAKQSDAYLKIKLSPKNIADLMYGKPILVHFFNADDNTLESTELCIDLQYANEFSVETPSNIDLMDTMFMT